MVRVDLRRQLVSVPVFSTTSLTFEYSMALSIGMVQQNLIFDIANCQSFQDLLCYNTNSTTWIPNDGNIFKLCLCFIDYCTVSGHCPKESEAVICSQFYLTIFFNNVRSFVQAYIQCLW